MRRRTFLVLSGSAGLAACTAGEAPPPTPGGPPLPLSGGASPGGAESRPAAILLPMSGPRADIGQAMLQAAQLAISQGNAPTLIPADSPGDPAAAVAAARGALGNGAGIILGPLTAVETQAVAPVATAAGVPVLAFTNTSSAAGPGVWTLGITPGQQVRRLVTYAQGQGRSRFAAFLPSSDFGQAMAAALSEATAERGLGSPQIAFHGHGMAAVSSGLKTLSAYEERWGPVQQQIKEARALGTREGREQAEQLTRTPVPPPPFDALLLGDTGDALAEVASVLSYYFVTPPTVQVMGPALWAAPASGAAQLRGAVYAAPDPAARQSFVQAFSARTGAPPPGPADLAYDAAAIARVTAPSGYATSALTNPDGFAGVDGWIRLLPDGEVRRGLAVFQIQSGGPQMVAPAPATPSSPEA